MREIAAVPGREQGFCHRLGTMGRLERRVGGRGREGKVGRDACYNVRIHIKLNTNIN